MGKIRRKDAKQEEERKARKAALKARKDRITEEPVLGRPLGKEKSPKKTRTNSSECPKVVTASMCYACGSLLQSCPPASR